MISNRKLLHMLAETSSQARRDVFARNALMKRLYDRGVPLRQLGQVTGLSHESVRKIVMHTPARRPRPMRVD